MKDDICKYFHPIVIRISTLSNIMYVMQFVIILIIVEYIH